MSDSIKSQLCRHIALATHWEINSSINGQKWDCNIWFRRVVSFRDHSEQWFFCFISYIQTCYNSNINSDEKKNYLHHFLGLKKLRNLKGAFTLFFPTNVNRNRIPLTTFPFFAEHEPFILKTNPLMCFNVFPESTFLLGNS